MFTTLHGPFLQVQYDYVRSKATFPIDKNSSRIYSARRQAITRDDDDDDVKVKIQVSKFIQFLRLYNI